MTANGTMVLWFILLVLVVQLLPIGGKWPWARPLVWVGLVLLSVVLVLLHALTLR